MPTYEYRCKSCSQHLEVVQSFTDDPLSTCEACGGELRKVFGSIGIAFKGSGFYKTDSRGGSKPSSGETGSGDGGSGDAKPAAEKKAGDKSADGGSKTETKKADPKPAGGASSATAKTA